MRGEARGGWEWLLWHGFVCLALCVYFLLCWCCLDCDGNEDDHGDDDGAGNDGDDGGFRDEEGGHYPPLPSSRGAADVKKPSVQAAGKDIY